MNQLQPPEHLALYITDTQAVWLFVLLAGAAIGLIALALHEVEQMKKPRGPWHRK